MAKTVKKKYKKKSMSVKAVVKAARKLTLKSVETKYVVGSAINNVVNDSIWSFSPTQTLSYGNTANTRIGDSVLLQSLTMTGIVNVDAAIYNAKFRIIVGWSRNQVANTSWAAAVLNPNDIFYVNPSTQWQVNKINNPSIMQVLYDEIIDINSNTSTGKDLKSFFIKINFKLQKFEYATVGGTIGKTRNLFCAILPMSNTVTTGTACGGFNVTTCLKFKDP